MRKAGELGLAELSAVVREQGAAINEISARMSASRSYQIAVQAAFAGLVLALQERGYITGSEVADALRQVRSSEVWKEQPDGAVAGYLDALETILMTLKPTPYRAPASTEH